MRCGLGRSVGAELMLQATRANEVGRFCCGVHDRARVFSSLKVHHGLQLAGTNRRLARTSLLGKTLGGTHEQSACKRYVPEKAQCRVRAYGGGARCGRCGGVASAGLSPARKRRQQGAGKQHRYWRTLASDVRQCLRQQVAANSSAEGSGFAAAASRCAACRLAFGACGLMPRPHSAARPLKGQSMPRFGKRNFIIGKS